jgi:hypothetical protein
MGDKNRKNLGRRAISDIDGGLYFFVACINPKDLVPCRKQACTRFLLPSKVEVRIAIAEYPSHNHHRN